MIIKYTLTADECFRARLKDLYSLHRIVYDLFNDVRTPQEKAAGTSSAGFVFRDLGVMDNRRTLLIISDRAPREPALGRIETKVLSETFLAHDQYRFNVLVNPVKQNGRKITALRSDDEICQWFANKAGQWGFEVASDTLDVRQTEWHHFSKSDNRQVTVKTAELTGVLHVLDRELFQSSVRQGIGRSKAFGCGLLQVSPF